MELDVTDEQYAILEDRLAHMMEHRRHYIYNYPGLAAAAFDIKIKVWHTYYCSEFVHKMLTEMGIEVGHLPKVPKPIYLKNVTHRPVYTGLLSEYRYTE